MGSEGSFITLSLAYGLLVGLVVAVASLAMGRG